MRILHVITSLLTGGAEKLMVDLLPRMKEQGHEVELCRFMYEETPFLEELRATGLKMYAFRKGGNVYSLLHIARLWKLLNKGNYDIVHTHNTAPEMFAAIVSVFKKVHLVTTEHSTSNRRRSMKWYAPIDRWMFRQYESVICISDQSMKNHCQHMGKGSNENACVIYNGIDFNKYKSAEPVADVLGIKEKCTNSNFRKKIITNVAGFRAEKDQPTLIKALQHLPEEYHLCLVGDGVRREEFELLIANLKLQDRVHLLGLRSDVPNVLAASDYVVMCSHYEGLSLSSLEGMASGKPFLADNVDGLREIVSGHGVMFEHEDSKGFADAILKLESDASMRESVVKSCQEKASQYDISNVVSQYLAVYETLLNS